MVAIISCMSISQSLPNFNDNKTVNNAPSDDSSWIYHNSTSAKIYEVHDGEIILNGGEYSKINSTGYHLIESAPSGNGASGGCDVVTFHLNGSWFKLQGRNIHIYNGTGWEFTDTNEQQYVNSINCYRRFIRIDYENLEFTIASFAASRGPSYEPQHCYYATFFSTFNENGSFISTKEYYHHIGAMQQTSNGQCKAQADGTTQGGSQPVVSNRNIILSSNESLVHGYESYSGSSESTDYVLTYANNDSEAFRMVNYQNIGYNEGVNYFRNESGEHIIFRDKNEIISDIVIVTLHSNGTVTNRTIIDPFPQSQDCIQAEFSGLFGIPSYIQCENGDVVDIENQSYHNYGSYTPTIIGDVEDMPEIGLRSGSIITVDSDDDGVEYFSDECPNTVADEEVDQYGCSDDQYIDRWIKIELKSWEADQSVYWDSDEGLPDPRFHVIIDVDGDEFATYTSQTWENTWTLGHVWNLSVDIPNGARIIDIEIQCEDNDALNDDECEMNDEDGEWKLFFQFDVSGPSVVDFSGDGTNDNDTSWREASSNWTISYLTFDEIDSDDDGVINLYDDCPGYDDNIDADSDEIPDGCDDFIDSDGDGVIDDEDQCPGHDDAIDADSDEIVDGCDNFIDSDGDGTPDEDDWCPDTPLGAIVDWGCPMDEDEDGVYDGLDDCPNSVGYSGVDANGCDLDSDSDGIPDFDDECPNTPQGEEIDLDDYDYWGCSSSQIDRDDDGVNDNLDQCPNSVGYSGVDANGCDLDSDGDGTPDFDDECANTPQGATVDYMGCPSDLDGDGVFDGIDECPSSNNPAPSDMDKSGEVDSTGCFKQTESTNDDVNSDSESSSGSSFDICFGLFGILIIGFIIKRGSSKSNSVPVTTVPNQMPTHGQQIQSVVNRLEQQRVNAQYEANQLKKQLADTASLSSTQMQSMQSEMKRLQETVAQAENEKSQLQDDLEKAKSTAVVQNVQNITYNIQDSAISGDLNVTGVDQKEE